jgi:hypothetical protein
VFAAIGDQCQRTSDYRRTKVAPRIYADEHGFLSAIPAHPCNP